MAAVSRRKTRRFHPAKRPWTVCSVRISHADTRASGRVPDEEGDDLMAISKRLRYEILRRDNHACRYCGRAAPDVKLHIDHVVPQVLGGSDDPSNLVTSCAECNAGKTSSVPDQHVVADVSGSAAKWSAAMAQAAEEIRRTKIERDAVYEAVLNAWPAYYHDRIPHDYYQTIDQFLDAGLDVEVIVEMAWLASSKPGVTREWAYFCGCCWTRIRQLQERALAIVEEVSMDSPRDIAVMDAADELELVDG